MKVNSTIKLNMGKIANLTKAQRMALEMTAEAVHTDMVQSQVMPFDTGNLQNTQTFVDYSDSASGKITIAFNTPYARRLYYHPEFNFTKSENLFCTDDEPDSARLHLCALAHACRTEIYHAPYPRGDFDGRSARQLLRPYPSGLCRGFYLYQPDRLPDLQRS